MERKDEKKNIKNICIYTLRRQPHQPELILLNIPKVSTEKNNIFLHTTGFINYGTTNYILSVHLHSSNFVLADGFSPQFFALVPTFFDTYLSHYGPHVSISVYIYRATRIFPIERKLAKSKQSKFCCK